MPSTLNLSDPTIANQYLQMLRSQYGGDSQQVRDIYNQAISDFQQGGGYTCYPDGNTHKLGEPCGSAGDGNFCEGGMTCNKMCTKFCCDDTRFW